MKITEVIIDLRTFGDRFWLIEIKPVYVYDKDNKRMTKLIVLPLDLCDNM